MNAKFGSSAKQVLTTLQPISFQINTSKKGCPPRFEPMTPCTSNYWPPIPMPHLPCRIWVDDVFGLMNNFSSEVLVWLVLITPIYCCCLSHTYLKEKKTQQNKQTTRKIKKLVQGSIVYNIDYALLWLLALQAFCTTFDSFSIF